jgi:serine/threonine protein kinase
MERASCDLLTYLEKNKVENESEVLRMILQVVAGVEHLHSK